MPFRRINSQKLTDEMKTRVLLVKSNEVSENSWAKDGEKIGINIYISRALGAETVHGDIYTADGFCERRKARYEKTENGTDIYTLTPDLQGIGIYFVEFKIKAPSGIFGTSFNGNDGVLLEGIQGTRWQFLVVDGKETSPVGYTDGIIYHIFVDRFCSDGTSGKRDDAVYRTDWNGTPEFAKKTGDFLANNTFFGGTIGGIISKFDYIASLSACAIYLSPVFKAYSNHKYDVGDYMTVDEDFGGDEALKSLIDEAGKRGISVILDGVFNHVGDDSRYFNKYGKYDSTGAYQSEKSPYYKWFNFTSWPDEYDSWWGISNLPKIRKTPQFRKFICSEVLKKYAEMGIGGWRLDVVDELEGSFLKRITAACKSYNKNSMVIGEVWEDASCKRAYGEYKAYFEGGRLDGVMNYPLRDAVIDFVKTGKSKAVKATLKTLCAHYPLSKLINSMSILGTHDTARIITVLGGEASFGIPNEKLAVKKLSNEQREKGKCMLKSAYKLITALPGIPTVFYGDEVGLEGYDDPFNRRTYPWGNEDKELLKFYQTMGNVRKSNIALQNGETRVLETEDDVFAFVRETNSEKAVCVCNRSDEVFEAITDGLYMESEKRCYFNGVITVKPGETSIFIKQNKISN